MTPEALERFVDADEAAKFLSLNRRRILELARAGKLPGHPIGEGARRVWRFRLSELAAAVTPQCWRKGEGENHETETYSHYAADGVVCSPGFDRLSQHHMVREWGERE